MLRGELERAVSAILPRSAWGEDEEGQLIIYTGLTEDYNSGEVSAWEAE